MLEMPIVLFAGRVNIAQVRQPVNLISDYRVIGYSKKAYPWSSTLR